MFTNILCCKCKQYELTCWPKLEINNPSATEVSVGMHCKASYFIIQVHLFLKLSTQEAAFLLTISHQLFLTAKVKAAELINQNP